MNRGLMSPNQHFFMSDPRQGLAASAHLQHHASWPGSNIGCSTFNTVWKNWVIVGKYGPSVSLLPNCVRPEVTCYNSLCLGSRKSGWFISEGFLPNRHWPTLSGTYNTLVFDLALAYESLLCAYISLLCASYLVNNKDRQCLLVISFLENS